MGQNQGTVRLVIAALAVLASAVVVGGIYLTAIDKSLPGELIAIGSAAAGAIGGILSKTGDASEPQQVQVMNEPADPVPVEGADGGYVTYLGIILLVVVLVIIFGR